MALILPKGIVINSDQVNESIERIASDPLDQAQIAEFWKVYTTTTRRLLDPTAERLENHWWRIWYSDRKHLSGATIARLFDHISNGPTFVPLRGPPNREEPEPTLPNRSIRQRPAAASTTALRRNGSSTNSGLTAPNPSSISKAPVPMPHPILKKTRGPSTNGPRPTARFVSPHESEHEDNENVSMSPNSHVVVQPPSPDPRDGKSDRKTPSTARKKTGFSASNKKKRPVIVRRQSSQTSQSSADTATKESEAISALSGGGLSSLDRAPARIVSRFQENFTPSPEKSTSNHMLKKPTPDTKRSSSRKSPRGKGRASSSKLSEAPPSKGDPGPSSQLRRVENLQEEEEKEVEELTTEELEELELQSLILAEANARLHRKKAAERASAARERQTTMKPPSNTAGTPESSGVDAMRLVQHDPKGTPSLASTLADATGHLALGEVAQSSLDHVAPTREQKGKGRATEETAPVDVFAKRPVLPAAPASVEDGMSRSKSQLTLLLKKDKEKSTRNEKEVKRRK